MPKTKNNFFTVEDLIKFCKTNKMYNFSSKENGKPIVVQSIQDFSSADIEESEDGKLYCKVRVCHTLLNRNNSFISEDSMTKAMPTLKYAPLLAMIHQLDDGSWDFHSHDYHVETDEDGNEYTVYDEQQIGTFTADEPYLEYDEDMDKTYVVARVAIPEEYTRAASIIKAKRGTKVSCELIVYECSYNAKSKYLQIDDFRFNGCACLGSEKDGTPIGEGMVGSKLTLEDFSEDNNSLVKFTNQLIEMQERLNKLESACFNDINDNLKEGGSIEVDTKKDNFEEVTETVEVTETEETTEEEVTVTENESEETVDETSEEETIEETTEEVTVNESVENTVEETTENTAENFEVEVPTETQEQFEKMVRTYEISHEDLRYALYNLLDAFCEADNDWYWISNVYDTYFVYENWDGTKIYRQDYTKDGDNVAFENERIELFKELLTASEKAELEAMRSNYAALKEFKENIEKNELHAQKEEILYSEKYAVLAEKNEEGNFVNADFAKLVKDMDNYSLTDLETKIKVMHSDFVTEHPTQVTFSAHTEPKKKMTSVKLFANPNNDKKTKPSRYGNLFKESK